jgi:polypeptide N-acetylgalactosaminyltransferase
MITAIIYATDLKYLDKTIDGLLDRTPSIDEIIVCDDAGLGYTRTGVRVLTTDKVGRAKAWNAAAEQATGKTLIFLKDKTKVSDDWTLPLLKALQEEPQSLVSPVVHTLDLGLWMTEASRWRRFGWRWDLNLYDRTYTGRDESPAVSSYCIAVAKDWFNYLGGFDQGMQLGSGEDIEISLRSWLLGGSCRVCDDSTISVALEIDYGQQTLSNLARIAEAWFPGKAGYFYAARGLKPEALNVGRLSNLTRLAEKQKRPFEWFLGMKQPELFGIYDLKASAKGKSVAVVAPGPSLDVINPAMILRHDVVIGVDYVAKMFDCDFVFTDAVHVLAELRGKYQDNRFVVPVALQDRTAGKFVAASEVVPTAQQFELGQSGAGSSSLDPPLANFDSLALAAIHFALFLEPASVTVFGFDNKIIGGKSHTSKIDHYDDGRLWPDTDSTRRRFAFYEFGLDQLGRLAHAAGIPLLRVSHA